MSTLALVVGGGGGAGRWTGSESRFLCPSSLSELPAWGFLPLLEGLEVAGNNLSCSGDKHHFMCSFMFPFCQLPLFAFLLGYDFLLLVSKCLFHTRAEKQEESQWDCWVV